MCGGSCVCVSKLLMQSHSIHIHHKTTKDTTHDFTRAHVGRPSDMHVPFAVHLPKLVRSLSLFFFFTFLSPFDFPWQFVSRACFRLL